MRRAACFFVVRTEYQGASSMRPGTTPPPALRGGGRRIGQIAPIKSALQNPAGAGIITIIAQHSAPEK